MSKNGRLQCIILKIADTEKGPGRSRGPLLYTISSSTSLAISSGV